jgi:hypothetical protein
MDWRFGVMLTVFLLVLVVAGYGVRKLVSVLARQFGGGGGWAALAKVFATSRPMPPSVLLGQNIVVGLVIYRRSMSVGSDDAGLYLEPGFPVAIFVKQRLFIPWAEIRKVEESLLFWRKAFRLSIGDPCIGEVTAQGETVDRAIRPHIRLPA